MDTFEVPYAGKLWVALLGAIMMCAAMAAASVAIRDPSSTPAARVFLWILFFVCALPALVFTATLAVMLVGKRSLRLTAKEISAPRFGFSLHNTHVPLDSVQRVALLALPNGHRSLDIYHNAGRLRIAEILMPNAQAFDRVLAAFSNTPGANNSREAGG